VGVTFHLIALGKLLILITNILGILKINDMISAVLYSNIVLLEQWYLCQLNITPYLSVTLITSIFLLENFFCHHKAYSSFMYVIITDIFSCVIWVKLVVPPWCAIFIGHEAVAGKRHFYPSKREEAHPWYHLLHWRQ